jgi:hypothetical protein
VDSAADNAVYNAVYNAVDSAVRNAVYNAVDSAVYNAVDSAVDSAVGLNNEYIGINIDAMLEISNNFGVGKFGLECAKRSFNCYQGGNAWGGWMAYLSFFRDVCDLDVDGWDKYAPWETLGVHSGFRVVHEEFCMISEKPCKLEVDEMFQPHCDTGPYIQWRDGTGIYATHGVIHPAWITEKPEWITLEKIDAEENADIRQVMIFKYGEEKYLTDSGAKVVQMDEVNIGGGVDGKIVRALMRDKKGSQFLLTHDGSTDRIATMSVSPTAKTCRDAHYSISGFWDEDCLANS